MKKVILKTSQEYREELIKSSTKYTCPECSETVSCWNECKIKTKWWKKTEKFTVYKCSCGCSYKVIE